MTVHFMGFGMTACMMAGVPKDWAAGHRWSGDWDDVTCQDCLKGREPAETFVIAPDGKSITCKRCNRTSYHPKDAENHYCAYCRVFHDDLWPPIRHRWTTHPEPDLAIIKCDCGTWFGVYKKELVDKAHFLWGAVACKGCGASLEEKILKVTKELVTHEAHQTHQP